MPRLKPSESPVPFSSEYNKPPSRLKSWAMTVAIFACVFAAVNWVMEYISDAENDGDRTCAVLSYLIHRSNESLPTIEYYEEHPDELEEAQLNNAFSLKLLGCEPVHVPYPPPSPAEGPRLKDNPQH